MLRFGGIGIWVLLFVLCGFFLVENIVALQKRKILEGFRFWGDLLLFLCFVSVCIPSRNKIIGRQHSAAQKHQKRYIVSSCAGKQIYRKTEKDRERKQKQK